MPLLTSLVAADTYGRCRPGLRRRMQAYQRQRTVALGPHLRLRFEDRLTVSYQTLEAMHAQRLDPGFDAEEHLTRYAHLLPDAHSLSATLTMELPRAAQHGLAALHGAPHEVRLEVQGQPPLRARINAEQPGLGSLAPEAVHGLRFELSQAARAALLEGAPACLCCRHGAGEWCQALSPALVMRLRAGLGPGAWAAGLAAALGSASAGATDGPAHCSHAEGGRRA